MKCTCGDTMEYNMGGWECDSCGSLQAIYETKNQSFLITDEEDFYITDKNAIHATP